ncbi:MAG TPA: transporter substrate-binding domain-containing protein [Candidatus Acidoferrales bacterium]|nr:transporter substrate-binding domain-containing protein [Candidatus Acidoferrales bacterium]
MPKRRRVIIAVTALILEGIVLLAAFYGANLWQPKPAQISTQELAALTYYTEQYPPYNYLENGSLKGVSVELLSAITEKLGTKVTPTKINLTAWTDGYQTALTQNNTVLFSTVRLPERESSFKWAGPICTYQYALFAGWDKTTAVNSTEELKNYKIGVINDDAAIPLLLAAGVDSSQLVNETSAAVLIEKLAHGDIDFWCYPEEVGRFICEQETGDYYAFNVVYRLESVDLYYAFNKQTPDSTVNAFQQALDELKAETDASGFSTYEMLLGQYIPSVGFPHLNYLTEEWAPFNYADNKGEAAGISVEILQAVFRHAGVTSAPEVKIVPLADGFAQTQKNSSTVLFSIVRTAAREPYYQWVGPFTKANFVIYSASESNISIAKGEDLNNYRIGTVNGTIEYDMLINQGVDSSNVVLASTPAELLQMLHNGEIDLWATGEFTGHYEINKAGLDTKDFQVVYSLGEMEFYFIFSKDVPDLVVDAFGHALQSVRNQKDAQGFSEYERIIYRNLDVGYAKQTFTNQEVMALVDETAAKIALNATDTFLHINAGEAPYKSTTHKGLYVFVYDTNITMIAHADNILLVDVNFRGKTDVAGTPFRDYIVQGAIANGTGWVDYIYSNSAQSNLYYKTTYYRLVVGSDGNQYVVCAGNFKN